MGRMVARKGQPVVGANIRDSLDEDAARIPGIMSNRELARSRGAALVSIWIDEQPVAAEKGRFHAVAIDSDARFPRTAEAIDESDRAKGKEKRRPGHSNEAAQHLVW